MRGDVHVQFGGRARETDQLKSWNRALVRPCSQIQALDRTQPSLPMKKGRAGTMTHDYKRNGTTTLFAALNVLTGLVIGQCLPRHRHTEFLKFLRTIDREVPKGMAIHMILDNYGTHKHENVQKWLAKHPRFHLHFIPTSSSWLNLVLVNRPSVRVETSVA
jgi:transposase